MATKEQKVNWADDDGPIDSALLDKVKLPEEPQNTNDEGLEIIFLRCLPSLAKTFLCLRALFALSFEAIFLI